MSALRQGARGGALDTCDWSHSTDEGRGCAEGGERGGRERR